MGYVGQVARSPHPWEQLPLVGRLVERVCDARWPCVGPYRTRREAEKALVEALQERMRERTPAALLRKSLAFLLVVAAVLAPLVCVVTEAIEGAGGQDEINFWAGIATLIACVIGSAVYVGVSSVRRAFFNWGAVLGALAFLLFSFFLWCAWVCGYVVLPVPLL